MKNSCNILLAQELEKNFTYKEMEEMLKDIKYIEAIKEILKNSQDS
ncbi:hypothetical protein G8S49_01270 [Clostridium botulinum C]|uniref:Uncharacterized protein n=1 Tax=Clostridium botulinum C TaxID=36828 RepID=A0A9Q3V608_CLOBO|nr:hypothetical protein [Clostridium botulinum]MCD3194206.1 hypothetical protein [Clostridium botulinum C]MCD3199165.1 hypothetical protein [Clostridium botulinum C]MCD3204640.1 hypothetical protein [Clostridium botulinum C]MCD3207983.1 hypothetical protein [Clostridium botulinum C]MCD3225077.1 hypothetical protein [Clostridium botulinum C]